MLNGSASRTNSGTTVTPAFRSIQALRAIAALLVVFYHVAPSFVVGAAGVDLFFVISGFIMGTIAIGEAPGRFLCNRMVRIVPLYWTVTILYLVCSFVPALSKSAHVSEVFFVKSLLFLPYLDPAGLVAPIVVAGWTLNFEMLFYLIFASALFTKHPRQVVTGAILLLVCAGWLARPASAPLQMWTAPIMFEFVFGVALSSLYANLSQRFGTWALVLGVLGFGCAQWFQTGGEGWGLARLVVWGAPAALIVTGALALENNQRWPRLLQPLERIGDASYSLYLLHGIVASVAYKIFSNSTVAGVVVVIGSVLVALLSFRYFEKPVTSALRGLIPDVAGMAGSARRGMLGSG